MHDHTKLVVSHHSVETLTPYKTNPRTHSDKQIRQIAKSIEKFGFTNPILIDETKQVIAGHGRLLAAKQAGLATVPTIRIDHMTAAQKRAYIMADNKLAENAGWDEDLLKLELEGILLLQDDFDLTDIGFETAELDVLLVNDAEIVEPSIPKLDDHNSISKEGDLWILGNHRLYCGDALNDESYESLLRGEKADMVFTDPPYNVPINGHVCGNGQIKHAEFAIASGEMTSSEFTAFIQTIAHLLQQNSSTASLHYICMDWRHARELLDGCSSYPEYKNMCVWNKMIGGMGSLYRSQHELVFIFKNGKTPHQNNVQLGKYGRNRTNVWDYPGVNHLGNKEKMTELSMHPTVKPVQMVADAIKDCTSKGHLILDAFGGSGSTLIAAEITKRRAALIEIEPSYVDVIIKRYMKFSNKPVIHDKTGLTFDEMGGRDGF